MKLSAASFAALQIAQGTATVASNENTPFINFPVGGGSAHRTGVQPGPAPATDEPLILKWTLTSSVDPNDTGYFGWAEATIYNGVLYVGGADHYLYALEPHTGDVHWTFELEGSVRDAPAVTDDTVFITTWQDSVYAINTETGAERWRYNITGNSSWGALVVDDVLYFSDGARIVALGTQFGEKRWTFIADGASIPTVNDGVLYTASYTHLHAIDLATGDQIWEFENSEVSIVAPIFHNDAILVGSSEYSIYAIDPGTGTPIWTFTTDMPVSQTYDSPNMRVSAAVETTVFAVADQRLFAIDSTNGQERWRVEMDKTESPRAAALEDLVLVADDYLSVRDLVTGNDHWRDNRFWGNEVLSRFSTPSINGGMVFAGRGDYFYAIGNLPRPRLAADVTLRGAPAESAVVRGTALAGDDIEKVGESQERDGRSWTEVTIGGVIGWIPTDAIDQSTFVPPADIEYVYQPGD